jgi:NAD kinase
MAAGERHHKLFLVGTARRADRAAVLADGHHRRNVGHNSRVTATRSGRSARAGKSQRDVPTSLKNNAESIRSW